MSPLLWFLLCFLGANTALMIVNLVIGTYPREKTRGHEAVDALVGVAIVCWICVVLFGG